MPSTSVTAQVGRSWSDCPHWTLSSRLSGVSPSLNSGPGRSQVQGWRPVCVQTWFLQLQAQRLKPHTLLLTGSLDLASQGDNPARGSHKLPRQPSCPLLAGEDGQLGPQPHLLTPHTASPSPWARLESPPQGCASLAVCALLLAWSCSLPPYLPSSLPGRGHESHPPAPDLSCPAWSLAGAFICQSLRTGRHAAYCLRGLVRCSKKCMDGHSWEVNKAQYIHSAWQCHCDHRDHSPSAAASKGRVQRKWHEPASVNAEQHGIWPTQ